MVISIQRVIQICVCFNCILHEQTKISSKRAKGRFQLQDPVLQSPINTNPGLIQSE